ncbi:hypothetical protein [Vulgatibacter sp.]|uniref:hypothetical protein n=1 Tax=Vulgatibacter sp. TaxID=1971226 RepID=UPI0035638BC7
MRRLLTLALFCLAACGVKGPPRPPGAAAPEALRGETCDECLVTEPQPGLVGEPEAEAEVEPEVEVEAVEPAAEPAP